MISSKTLRLAALASALSLSNLACAQTTAPRASAPALNTPTHATIDVSRLPKKGPFKDAAYIIVVDKKGNQKVLGANGKPAQKCTEQRGPRQCNVFRGESKVKSLKTSTILEAEGSYIYTFLTAYGQYIQFCYDDYWNPIDCAELF